MDTTEPGKTVPETGPLPDVPVATPVRIAGQATPRSIGPVGPTPINTHPTPRIASGAPTPISVTPLQITRLITPAPKTGPYVAAVTPIPGRVTPLPTTSPDGVPLERFRQAPPTPSIQVQRDAMRDNSASWRTYAPGQAPPAKTVSLDEVGTLADRGEVNERLYLKGEFRVTASGTSRAVLRDATRNSPSGKDVHFTSLDRPACRLHRGYCLGEVGERLYLKGNSGSWRRPGYARCCLMPPGR